LIRAFSTAARAAATSASARQAEYRHLHERYRLIAVFNERPLTFSHPRILVYANPDTPAGAGLITLTGKK
jgi:hypothetical protein